MTQVQNVKVVSPTGQITYFSGDSANIPKDNSTIYNAPTPTGYYSGVASGYPITLSSLAPATLYNIPSSQPDTTHYPSLIADGNARIASGITTGTTDTSTKTNQTDLQKQLNDLVSGTSSIDLYNTARTNAGLDTAQADALAKRNAVRTAQAELAGVQAQIQAVQDSANRQNLQLGQNATGGLITTNFLGRQQQEINRQAAIAALPLQALALSAQAKVASLQGDEAYAQSTLKAAQDKLDTTFKLMSDDATRKQNLQLKIFDTMYSNFTAKEKAKAEVIKEQTARNQANLMDVRNAAQTAFQASDDKSLYAKFVQIPIPDVTSKTFVTDLQAYNEKVAALQGQIRPKPTAEQISQSTIASVNKRLTEAKGSDGYTDPNLYARLRSSSTLSANDFDNRFGYLINPLSAARLGITKSVSSTGLGTYTTTQQQTLIGAGIPATKIGVIEQYVNQYGLQATLNNSDMTDAQKTALKAVYGQ